MSWRRINAICRAISRCARKTSSHNLAYAAGLGGCPLLSDTLASFQCSTENTVVGGDHIIFIGRVHRATYRDGEPLIFSAGQYCTHPLLGGAADQ